MVRLGLLAMIIAGIVFQQCSDETPELFTLNQEFEAREAELVTLELEQDQGHINLQVLEITESRCPSDVVCVRFGEAEVKVGVSGVEEILKTLDLCIGDCLQRNKGVILADTVAVEIDGKDYAVILKDVIPFPSTTNQDKTKEAILEVISQ
jgi:hypothetical protein